MTGPDYMLLSLHRIVLSLGKQSSGIMQHDAEHIHSIAAYVNALREALRWLDVLGGSAKDNSVASVMCRLVSCPTCCSTPYSIMCTHDCKRVDACIRVHACPTALLDARAHTYIYIYIYIYIYACVHVHVHMQVLSVEASSPRTLLRSAPESGPHDFRHPRLQPGGSSSAQTAWQAPTRVQGGRMHGGMRGVHEGTYWVGNHGL